MTEKTIVPGSWQEKLAEVRANSTMTVTPKGLDELSSTFVQDLVDIIADRLLDFKPGLLRLLKADIEGFAGREISDEEIPPVERLEKNLNDWSFQKDAESGRLVFQRNGGGYHQAMGLGITTGTREVSRWGQLILFELGGGGFVVMARESETDRYLLAAREEPGNGDSNSCILWGAPLQTSIANANQVHGGAKPPRWDWIVESIVNGQPQDGGRYFGKVNNIGSVDVDFRYIDPLPNERIFTRDELREALHAGECNSHLAEVCGHLFV